MSEDYLLLYNIIYNYDWSFVYSETTVNSQNSAVHLAMDQAIPRGSGRKSKFTNWFPRLFKTL